MDKHTLIDALKSLDQHLTAPVDIILVGGAAMILGYGADRATRDVDVLITGGNASDVREAARKAADERDLPEDWLNDAAKGIADILPPDVGQRLTPLDQELGQASVSILGRADLAAMKIVALREQDLEDLALLLPDMTSDEKKTLTAIMHHVATSRIDWAQKIRYFLLEQGWEIE